MVFRSLLLAVLWVAASCAGALAAEPQVPVFWDAKERLPKPDLSTLPRLRFLTTTDFPPFNFLDGNGRLSGFHVDLARAICAELGHRRQMPDPGAALGRTGSRAAEGRRRGDHRRHRRHRRRAAPNTPSRGPICSFPARFIMPKTSAVAEPIFEKLRGERVGVVAGSAHERMLRAYFPRRAGRDLLDSQEWLSPTSRPARSTPPSATACASPSGWRGSDAAGCCRFAGGPYLAPEYLGDRAWQSPRTPDDPALAAAFDYALHADLGEGHVRRTLSALFPGQLFLGIC